MQRKCTARDARRRLAGIPLELLFRNMFSVMLKSVCRKRHKRFSVLLLFMWLDQRQQARESESSGSSEMNVSDDLSAIISDADYQEEVLARGMRQHRDASAAPRPKGEAKAKAKASARRVYLPQFNRDTLAYHWADGSVAGKYTGWPPESQVNQRVTCKIQGHGGSCLMLKSARRLPHHRAWAEWLARGWNCKNKKDHLAAWGDIKAEPVEYVTANV